MKFYSCKSEKAQVWIETVLYTLIAFTIIGLVLAYAQPEIEKYQDKSIIKQSITLMSDLDSKISEVSKSGEGNKRVLEISVKKGSLNINATKDQIVLEIESTYPYTEPGEEYSEQGITITTISTGERNKIKLLKNYNETLNLTYSGREETKTLSQSSTFYKIYMENKGDSTSGKTIVEIGLV
jgi:type II secretory pathway pseudopilin PulG